MFLLFTAKDLYSEWIVHKLILYNQRTMLPSACHKASSLISSMMVMIIVMQLGTNVSVEQVFTHVINCLESIHLIE